MLLDFYLVQLLKPAWPAMSAAAKPNEVINSVATKRHFCLGFSSSFRHFAKNTPLSQANRGKNTGHLYACCVNATSKMGAKLWQVGFWPYFGAILCQ